MIARSAHTSELSYCKNSLESDLSGRLLVFIYVEESQGSPACSGVNTVSSDGDPLFTPPPPLRSSYDPRPL